MRSFGWLLAVVWTIGCANEIEPGVCSDETPCEPGKTLVMHLTYDGDATLGPDSQVVAVLYGSDVWLADATASRVVVYQVPGAARYVPGDVELVIPATPHAHINQGSGPVEADDASFYFSVYVDADGDGRVCRWGSDLSENFGPNGPANFGTDVPDQMTVPLKDHSGGCRLP